MAGMRTRHAQNRLGFMDGRLELPHPLEGVQLEVALVVELLAVDGAVFLCLLLNQLLHLAVLLLGLGQELQPLLLIIQLCVLKIHTHTEP